MPGLPRSDGVVTLRALREGDGKVLIAGRDDEFRRWMGQGAPDPQPTAVIEVAGTVVGWVDHDRDDTRTWLERGEGNIGYHVFASHRGQRVARRAVRLLLDLLAEDHRYRTATFLVDAENEASLRVARAVGASERRRFEVDGRPQVLLAAPIGEDAWVISIDEVDGVRVVRMVDGENTFSLPFVRALASALDAVADPGGPLVLTGDGKVFSNGLDLAWLGAAAPEDAAQMFRDLHGTLARLLRYPGAVVAAINGHAFGAGAILAAAADLRVQRADRGYLCFPEVDLGLSMSDEFDAVLRAKLPTHSVLKGLLTGERLGGPRSLELGLVDAIAGEDELLTSALDLVRDLVGKDPATVRAIKEQQHKAPLAILDAGS